MIYSNEKLEKFSKYNNRKLFEKVKNARCYYCGSKMLVEDILKLENEYVVWDKKGSCFCPYCSVDAVLPEHEDYDIMDDDFIHRMFNYWFLF